MKTKVINKNKRDKAFIGAAIGAVANIAGGIFGGIGKKKQLAEQQEAQNKADTLQAAQALTSSYANQNYIKDYAKKVTLRMGGSEDYKNRFTKTKESTRKKAKLGADEIGGLITAGSNAITTTMNAINGTNISPLTNNINLTKRIKENKEIAGNVDLKKEGQTINTINSELVAPITKMPEVSIAKMGTKRKKGLLGLDSIIGGVGSLAGGILGGNNSGIKKSDGVMTSAPKTGITNKDYNVNNITTNNPALSMPYQDRFKQFKTGGKKRNKC